MKLSVGQYTLACERFGTEREFAHTLSKWDGDGTPHTVLGRDADATEFYTIRVRAHGLSFAVAVRSEGHGIRPHVLVDQDANRLWIGFNSSVAYVDAGNGQPVAELTLQGLFRDFLVVPPAALLLVFDEIGVSAVSDAGELRWQYAKDVLESYTLEGNTLFVTFMDSPAVRINVLTGAVQTG